MLGFAAISISACATKTIYIEPQPLPLPAIPQFTKISVSEFTCLTDHTYKKFRLRDTEKDSYIHQLRSIIESTYD